MFSDVFENAKSQSLNKCIIKGIIGVNMLGEYYPLVCYYNIIAIYNDEGY